MAFVTGTRIGYCRGMGTAAAFVLALVTATTVRADLNCDGGSLRHLALRAGKGKVTARATFEPAGAFDPTSDGLAVLVAIDPETDPGRRLIDTTLPPDTLRAKKRGWVYRDRTGTRAGLRRLRLTRARDGRLKLTLKRSGTPLVVPEDASAARLVIGAGGACARTCSGTCESKGKRFVCRRSEDTALCGLRSGCEPFGVGADGSSRHCLLPYPSDFFTRPDEAAPTGRRIDYRSGTMPVNRSGTPVDPGPYTRLDGFSPGALIMAHFPAGVDLAASGVASPLDVAASLAPQSPTLLVEADTGGCALVEHFGENDVSDTGGGVPVAPPDQLFMIRPGRRLQNGARYIVALRGLVDPTGAAIAPPPAFRALRDGTDAGSAMVEARRGRMSRLLAKLETDCGVDPAALVLAWDFTVASDETIGRYLMHMRDQTFAQYPGTTAPPFVVDAAGVDPAHPLEVCRLVEGRYTVPLWTTFDGPGSVLNLDPATDLPVQNGVTTEVPFTVMIPCSLTQATPRAGRPIVYGHGLLGTGAGEVTAGNLRRLANTHDFVIAATDWQGFSEHDLPVVFDFIGDLSGFPRLSERLHQGVLNQLVLARLLRAPGGFASHPAFQVEGTPLIDTAEVYFYGNSQGGIEGGVVMALSQETTRGVLGVPAANYSTMLHRSRDFEVFFVALRTSYPDPVARGLLLGVIQQLWDRSEPNGWYHKTLSGIPPHTPPHDVLILMARSDDEVANLATEIMVRSMAIAQMAPVNRSFFGIAELPTPFDGSMVVESDFGEPDPPVTNTPPADNDVHGAMRGLPEIQAMIDRFLRPDGESRVENLCTAGATAACDPN